MRTDWTTHRNMELVLSLLTPSNRLVVELMLTTGLRISDALGITAAQYRHGQRITIHEQKTGKTRRIYIPKGLYSRLAAECGDVWLFPGRHADKHRTRQAVWKDVKRAAHALRISVNLAPHSARKIYAVDLYHERGFNAAMHALNHNDQSTTMIYILSDLMMDSDGTTRRTQAGSAATKPRKGRRATGAEGGARAPLLTV